MLEIIFFRLCVKNNKTWLDEIAWKINESYSLWKFRFVKNFYPSVVFSSYTNDQERIRNCMTYLCHQLNTMHREKYDLKLRIYCCWSLIQHAWFQFKIERCICTRRLHTHLFLGLLLFFLLRSVRWRTEDMCHESYGKNEAGFFQ